MHFIIGFAFVLLSGSVAAQQATDESTAVQECNAPKVWAYCAGLGGSALPPTCINPEEPNPDPSKPKLCASSCSCDQAVLNPATANQETLVPSPSRSYPPPRVIQWGETPEVPAVEKNLIKTPQFKSSYVPSYELAEYPEDAEHSIQQSPEGDTQLYQPNGEFIISPSSDKQNTILNPDDLPGSGNELFKLDADFNRNRPVPIQPQTPPAPEQDELKYQLPVPGS